MSLAVYINPLKKEEVRYSKILQRQSAAQKQIQRNLPPIWHKTALGLLEKLCGYDRSKHWPEKIVVSKNWPTAGSITVYRSDNKKYRIFYDGDRCKFSTERLFND